MYIQTLPHITLEGDEDAARALIPQAKSLLQRTAFLAEHTEGVAALATNLPGGGRIETKVLNGQHMVRVAGRGKPSAKKDITLIADYLLLTFGFTEEGGRDLDIRVRLVEPVNLPGGEPSEREGYLGWAFGEGYLSNTPPEDRLIDWGGDNRGYGVEQILIKAKRLFEDVSKAAVKIEARGFWYAERQSGGISIKIEAFVGGDMTRNEDSFSFTPSEEAKKTGEAAYPANVEMENTDWLNTGELITYINYNKASSKLWFSQT